MIVAAYVHFRMFEVFLSRADGYSSNSARVVACIFAVLVLIVISLCAIDILATGSNVPSLR
ncbi:MAG: hypothetical protein WAU89_20915, partial [Candidatus Acidiferrales bacterium]